MPSHQPSRVSSPQSPPRLILTRKQRFHQPYSREVPDSDAQQVVREVGLAEGLEVDLVGGLELALLEDRFLRQAREALAHLARELAVLQRRLVQRGFDQREAH